MDLHHSPMSPTNYGSPSYGSPNPYGSPSGGYQDYSSQPNYYDDGYNNTNNYDNYNNDNYSNQYNNYDSPAAQLSPRIESVPQAPPLPLNTPTYTRSQPTPPAAMPDAVLNMAAKGAPDKKPWAYAPDADMLKEHRDKVRRRKPSGGPDITQSATYKMIHGLDEPTPSTRPGAQRQSSEGFRSPLRQPSYDDETSFSGAGRRSEYDHIPSRAFHKLQSLTGGSEVDRSSIRTNVTGVSAKPTRRNLRRAESAPGPHYDEDQDGGVDIKYVGGHIPSRSFRMLQQSVGADPNDYDTGVANGMEPMVVAPSDPHAAARDRRRRRRRGSAPRVASQSPQRRPVLPKEQPHEARRDEFDEASYLAGRVPILRSEEEVQQNPVVSQNRAGLPKAAWQRPESPPARDFDEGAFLDGKLNMINDPDTETNLPPRAPRKKEFSARPDWARTVQRKKKERAFERSTSQLAQDREREQERAANQYIDVEEVPTKPINFDERAYLSGNVAIMDDAPKAPRPMENKVDGGPKVYEFQHMAQRRASTDFVDPLARAEHHAAFEQAKQSLDDDRANDNREPFDESAFLEGRMPVVSGEAKPRPNPRERRLVKEVPAWARRVSQERGEPAAGDDEGNFSERAFLQGQIPMVKGGTPDLRPVNRPRKKKPVRRPEDEVPVEREPFDEHAFLAGQVPILGGATDNALPPREPKKKVERRLAPWEKRRRDDDVYIPPSNEQEFEEKDFLQGKVPVLTGDTERQLHLPPKQALPPRGMRRPVDTRPRAVWEHPKPADDTEDDDSNQNQRIPSKTFIRLSRSVSSGPLDQTEADFEPMSPKPRLKMLRSSRGRKPKYDRSRSLSPGTAARRQKELQEGTTKDVPINELAYKGTHIPSKSFHRLQSHVDKPEDAQIDPLERLRAKKPPKQENQVDPEKALEKMSIQEHSPENYFDALQQVVEDRPLNKEQKEPQMIQVVPQIYHNEPQVIQQVPQVNVESKPEATGVKLPIVEEAKVMPKEQVPQAVVDASPGPSSAKVKVITAAQPNVKVITAAQPQTKAEDAPAFEEAEDKVTDF